MAKPTTVILGAGMMGLCVAEELSRRSDHNVVLLEREPETGGLCRGLKLRDQIFDFGPHAFWTVYQSSFDYCQRICGEDLLDLGLKDVSIHFRNNEYPYPLRIGATLRKLKLTESFKCLLSFAKVYLLNFFRRDHSASFEDYIQNHFGKELYKIFFKEYTRKVWGISPTELAASFAAERIPKITVKKTIRDIYRRLFKASKVRAHVSKRDPSHMYYPKFGFRGFVGQLAEVCQRQGAAIQLDAEVGAIELDGDQPKAVRYRVGGAEKRIACDHVVSTLPLNALVKLLGDPDEATRKAIEQLSFRRISFIFLVVNRPRVYTHQWVYYQDPDIYMNRVYETKAFGPYVSPNENETGLCVEVTNYENLSPENLIKRAIRDFEKLGVLKAEEVLASNVVEMDYGYPLYNLNYKSSLETLLRHVSRFRNVITAGRQGLFVYVDTDHCMKMAEIIVDHLVDAKPLDPLYTVVANHS